MKNPGTLRLLKTRPEYLAVAKTGRKEVRRGLVVQCRKTPGVDTIGLGLTVSGRVGNAVERNRVKRRLREAMKDIIPAEGKPGFTYVVIGRRGALQRPFELLKKDLKSALKGLHKQDAKSKKK